MKTNKIIIAVLSVALLAVAVFVVFSLGTREEVIPVSFVADCGKVKEKITCFENDAGEYYVFLPSFCDIGDVKAILETEQKVRIDGKEIYNDMSCKDFKTDKEYIISFKAFGKPKKQSITFLRSQNIPAMYIDTNSGNMDYIYAKKDNSETGKIRTYTADGKLDFAGDLTSINGRGNSTWDDYDKKPFSLTLTNGANLLSLGEGKRWILLANAADASHIRNKLAFDFAKELGLKYTADSIWVDLYLNGEYAGLYLLSERNEIAENRIDISNDALLVSLEFEDRLRAQNYSFVSTELNLAYRIHYPKNVNTKTKSEILKKLQSVEIAALSADGKDADSGKHWRELIDLESWAKKYLVDEVLGNLDGGGVSHYLYLDKNSDNKLYAGPVWDYDKALGNNSDEFWSITNPQIMVVNRYQNSMKDKNPVLSELCKKDEFADCIKNIFSIQAVFATNKLLNEKIPLYAKSIEKSANMDAARWSNTEFDFKKEISDVSSYLKEHTEFLNSVWIEDEEVCQLSFVGLSNDMFYSVKKGSVLPEIPKVEDTESAKFTGFYYSDTNEPFDKTVPITEDTEVYAKWENQSTNSIKTVIKYSPILVIAVIFLGLIIIDFKRNKRGGGK